MRRNVLSVRSRTLTQVAAVSLLASLTAACSGGASRFGIPDFTGSTANQKSIIGGADQPMPAPVNYPAPVQRTELPPPPAQQQAALLPGVAPAQPSTYQPPVYPTAPSAVAAAATPQQLAPVATAAAAAHKGGWDTTGGTVVTLGAGETLSSVSRRYGVPVKELAKANGITDPSQVGAGARITIPTFAAGAVAAASQGATQLAAGANPAADKKPVPLAGETTLNGLHVVAPGQTINSIARLYNVTPKEIETANNLTGNQIKSGQKLKIPGHSPSEVAAIRPDAARREEKAKGEDPNGKPTADNKVPLPVAKTATAKASPAPGATSDPVTTASIAPAPSAPAAAAAAEMAATAAKPQAQAVAYAPSDTAKTAAAEPADPPSTNGTSFRWPVRGRIIGSFGTAATGEKNDGINLAVPEGTSIKAVEAGTVIYAGNELEGYGELVLVRHADGWVSAYAHNSDILVKRGDSVRRGQIISRAGTSGSVSSPQLHFELRKGSKPVNPLDYLQG